jgi:hypothetical protein
MTVSTVSWSATPAPGCSPALAERSGPPATRHLLCPSLCCVLCAVCCVCAAVWARPVHKQQHGMHQRYPHTSHMPQPGVDRAHVRTARAQTQSCAPAGHPEARESPSTPLSLDLHSPADGRQGAAAERAVGIATEDYGRRCHPRGAGCAPLCLPVCVLCVPYACALLYLFLCVCLLLCCLFIVVLAVLPTPISVCDGVRQDLVRTNNRTSALALRESTWRAPRASRERTASYAGGQHLCGRCEEGNGTPVNTMVNTATT